MTELQVNAGSLNHGEHEVHDAECHHLLSVKDKRDIYPDDCLEGSVKRAAKYALNIGGCSFPYCSRKHNHILASISLCKDCLVVKRRIVYIR